MKNLTLAAAMEAITQENYSIDPKRLKRIQRRIKYKIAHEGFFDIFKSKYPDKDPVDSNTTKKTNNYYENHYETLKKLHKEFSTSLASLKQTNQNELELELAIPEHLNDIKDYTFSLSILLNSLKSIQKHYKQMPSFLDSVQKLGNAIAANGLIEDDNTAKKFHKLTADIILKYFKNKENLLTQSNLSKSVETSNNNSAEIYTLTDKNKVFTIATYDPSLVGETDYSKLTKDLTTWLDFYCSPIVEFWFSIEKPIVVKKLTVSKQDLIKHIEINVSILNTLIDIKDMIDTVDPSRGSAIMKKSTTIYDDISVDVSDATINYDDSDSDYLYGINDFFSNVGSWVEDHHVVKYEERNFNVLIKMLDKN